jgi:hypothetical protein
MKMNMLVVALFGVLAVAVAFPHTSQAEAEGIVVIATAYTCEAHPRNPMHPCGNPRWGGDRYAPGLACPYSWRNRYMEVPGYGVLRCDDTGAHDTWNGYPHIDIRVRTFAEADRMGFRRMTIYPVDGPVAEPAEETAPLRATTPDGALALAKTFAPKGDSATALVRLMHFARAREHFPELLQEVNLPAEQPIWLVSIWVPPSSIPEGSQATPDPQAEINARLLVFDAKSSTLLADRYIAFDTVEKIGWLASDNIALEP